MKLILLKNNLLEGLSSLERAVGITTNLPILKNVFIKAFENKIMLVATDLEIAIKHILPGKVMTQGEYTVPFSIFFTIIKNINTERITLELKEKKILVTTDNYDAAIQGVDTKDFPIIPSVSNTKQSIKLPVELFKNALANVITAAHYSEIRPEISGVFLKYSENQLTLVATDSFRLAEQKIESKQIVSTYDSVHAIIPLKAAEELLRIGRKDGELEIFVDQNQILFKTESNEVVSRLIDGRFPEYQAIIPKTVNSEVFIDRQEFLQAIRLTSSFSGRTNDILIKIGENKKFLELYSADASLGENSYRVPIKLTGDKFSIAFNWHYLSDGLKIYKNEEVVLGVNGSDRPVVIKTTKETSLLYVLMPIKA